MRSCHEVSTLSARKLWVREEEKEEEEEDLLTVNKPTGAVVTELVPINTNIPPDDRR